MSTRTIHPLTTLITRAQDIEAPAYAIPEGLDHLADALHAAYSDGVDAAKQAATWTTDGNGDAQGYARLLRQLQDGDPTSDDHLPAMPNLSGEMSGDPTPASLERQHLPELPDVTESDAFARLASQRGDDVEALSDAWEAGRDAVWSQCVEAELIGALPDPGLRTAAMLDCDPLPDVLELLELDERISAPEQSQLVQATYLEALERQGIRVGLKRGRVSVQAESRALYAWTRGDLTGTRWQCAALARDDVDGLRVELDTHGDLVDLEIQGLHYANQDGLYYPTLDADGEGIGDGLKLSEDELAAFLFYALANVLPVDHAGWWVNVGRHLETDDPRRELAERLCAQANPRQLYTVAELRETAANYARYAETARRVGNSSAADQWARTAERFKALADAQSHL